jgi:glycosyltransferase involved in cell wall biosynthesis
MESSVEPRPIAQSGKGVLRAGRGGKSALHVLTLTPFFPSAGDEVSGCFIAESTRALAEFGVTSNIIAAAPMHHRRKEPAPSAPADWVRYPQIPGNLGLSSAGRSLYLRLLVQAQRLHRERPIDVIHAHAALPCGQAAALLSRHLGIPFVVTLHGLDVFNSCFLDGIAARWRRKVSIDVYRAARIVICISGRVQRVLRDRMPEDVRSKVVYNGTDTSVFSPVPDAVPSQPELLIVGNLLVGKGHELVLQAIARLNKCCPQLHCRIIGDGPDRARFEALAAGLGIGPRVHFEGRRSRAEVADAMRACSLFVLPSRYEGLGCVYLEAMACGKPVIACRGQGIEEIIEHGKNGWLISDWSNRDTINPPTTNPYTTNPDTTNRYTTNSDTTNQDATYSESSNPTNVLDELAQGLSTLLASSELRSRLGTAGRDTILNRLTLSHQAERLVQVYSEAIA